MGEPRMIDQALFSAAGVSPGSRAMKYMNSIDQNGNTVRPDGQSANLKYESIYAIMQWQDLKEHIERYQWVNMPIGMDYEIIERILYYRGKLLGHYNASVGKFQHLPFALNKIIDEYGRFTRCNTLPFIGVTTQEVYKDSGVEYSTDATKKEKKFVEYTTMDIEIAYDDLYTPLTINDPEVMERAKAEWESGTDKGFILNDSSLALSQTPAIRWIVSQPVLAAMSTCYQIINTAMFAAADYSLIECKDQEEYESLIKQLDTINQRILAGKRFGAVMSRAGMDNLLKVTSSTPRNLQDLWECFNSLDNFRKSTLGVTNSGVFNKKEQMLQAEHALNGSNADQIYTNGLTQRQRWCDLFNQYYGTNMWCMSKKTPTQREMMQSPEGDGDDYATAVKDGDTAKQKEGGVTDVN